jgi:hypothetical protein
MLSRRRKALPGLLERLLGPSFVMAGVFACIAWFGLHVVQPLVTRHVQFLDATELLMVKMAETEQRQTAILERLDRR